MTGHAMTGAPIDAELLARLVCPVTRTPLRVEGDTLVSDAAGLAFPISDGVPVMLVRAARALHRLAEQQPG